MVTALVALVGLLALSSLAVDAGYVYAARTQLQNATDAAALVAHYEKMDRIADAIGIPLDAPMQVLGGELRDSLGIGKFTSAQNTKAAGPLTRLLQDMLRKIMFPVLKHLSGRNK